MKNIDENLHFIALPPSFKLNLGKMEIDNTKKLPLLLKEKKDTINGEDISPENIISGLITLLGNEDKCEDEEYYKTLLLSLDKDILSKLRDGGKVKKEQKDYKMSKTLLLCLYRLEHSSENCILLASLYSAITVEQNEKDSKEYRSGVTSVKNILKDGLEHNKNDENLLYELEELCFYLSEEQEALNYALSYLNVSKDNEKKKEIEKRVKSLGFLKDNADNAEEVYDLIILGKYDLALEKVNTLIEKNKNIWNLYFLRGWALRSKGEYNKAKEDFLKCISLGESNSDIYNELGLCELNEKNYEMASLYFESAIDLNEENLEALTNLSLLLLDSKRFDDAREIIEKARFLSPHDSVVKTLIKQYEEKSGERLSKDIVHEEYIDKDEVERLQKEKDKKGNFSVKIGDKDDK